ATTLTLHFLHVPWPPQVESIATPFQLAASKIVVPASTRASLTARSSPDWRKRRRTRSGCGASGRSSTALTTATCLKAGCSLCEQQNGHAKPATRLHCNLVAAFDYAFAACFARYMRI